MNWIKNNPVKILLIVINTILLTALMLSSYEVAGVGYREYILVILSTILPVIAISAGFLGLIKERKLLYITLIILGGAFLFFNWNFSPEFLAKQVTNINLKLGTSQKLVFNDFKFLIESLGVFLTLICLLSIYIYPWNIIITDIAFIFFLWAVDYLAKPGTRLLPFVFMWAFLLVHERAMARDFHFSHYREEKVKTGQRMSQVLVISIVIGLTTIYLLNFNKGLYYDRLWVKANDILMQDEFMAGNKFLNAFSLKNSGYNDSSERLGGDIKLDNNVMVSISGDAPKYLRGNTKYQYTGNLWLKNNFIYRTENSASADVTKFYSKATLKKMKVYPEGIRTSSIFVPSYPKTIIVEDRRPELKLYYAIKDQTFVLDDVTVLPYEVTYFDDDEVVSELSVFDKKINSDMEVFLEVPASVTDRTKELVNKIVEGKEGDKEKLEAIKDYLSKNYKYTLTPGDSPIDEDFVDNFLFEKKEGYCVHFASSMTIMARIAGIPARYAEGYKVPNDLDKEGNVLVKNEDAHAWTEVLVNGEKEIWAIYDATGSARDHSRDDEKTNQEKKDESQKSTKPKTQPNKKPKEITKPEEKTPSQTPKDNNEIKKDNNSRAFLKFLLVPLILLFLIFLLHLRKRIVIVGLIKDEGSKFLDYCLKLASMIGFPIDEKETYSQYLGAIKKQGDLEDGEKLPEDDNRIPLLGEEIDKIDEIGEPFQDLDKLEAARDAADLSQILEPLVLDTRAKIYGGIEGSLNREDKYRILDKLYELLGKNKGKFTAFLRKYLI